MELLRSTEIKAARTKRGWSQQKLSWLSGVPVTTISRIEGGHRVATVATLEKLAKALLEVQS